MTLSFLHLGLAGAEVPVEFVLVACCHRYCHRYHYRYRYRHLVVSPGGKQHPVN